MGSDPRGRRSSTGPGPHNLPVPRNGFLGRDRELAELEALVAGSRLVTLTGAPGVGKSRLGLELARALARDYSSGAWLAELGPLGDGNLVPAAVAAALSVGEVPGQSFARTLAAHIGRRRVLVVLDSCEHLLGACAELVETLLGGCPEVTILATSREALGLGGERRWALSPLAVPDPTDEPEPEALLEYPAVRLFVERAAAVEPRFVLSSYVAPAVAEICRRLDGIPMAIELAAARVDMLTPAEIARRLDDRFDLLISRNGAAVGRHQTLEAALDWSHGLLGEAERLLLRRLSVFAGGFDVQAAEAVCATGGIEGDVSELLVGLLSKSLVAVDAGGTFDARCRLLETIRAYASDRLEESGEAPGLREAHARFYRELAEAAEPGITRPGQARVLERLDHERENLRRALEWSLGHGHSEWALRLAGSLVLFWRVRCHFTEGRELLEAALSAGNDDAPLLRARALWGAGFLTMMAGDPPRAGPMLEQSLSVFREHGDLQGVARALLILGNCNQGRAGQSVLPLLEESAAVAREAGDRWCLSHALAVAGFAHASRGEFPAARALLEECLVVAREAEDDQGLRISLIALGSVAVSQGDYRLGQMLLEEALAIAGELHEGYAEAQALQHLGRLALGRGDYTRARQLLEQALALTPELAPPGTAVGMLLLQGRVAHAAGDREGARRRFEEVLVRASASPPAMTLQWMGELAVEEGDLDEGRRLLEAALAKAREADNKDSIAGALYGLGRLARTAGDALRAAALHHQALELQRQIGVMPAIIASIEALARLDAEAGGYEHSARLLGAGEALRSEEGYARHAWQSAGYEADMALVRRGLAIADFDEAFAAGGELSLEDAGALAYKGGGRHGRPSSGWASLTEREQQVALLAAEGLTNPEIADRLVITRATVKQHLWHIFSKLGISRRRELVHEGEARRGNGGDGAGRTSRAGAQR